MQPILKRLRKNSLETPKKITHQTVGLKVLMERKELQDDMSKKLKPNKERSNS